MFPSPSLLGRVGCHLHRAVCTSCLLISGPDQGGDDGVAGLLFLFLYILFLQEATQLFCVIHRWSVWRLRLLFQPTFTRCFCSSGSRLSGDLSRWATFDNHALEGSLSLLLYHFPVILVIYILLNSPLFSLAGTQKSIPALLLTRKDNYCDTDQKTKKQDLPRGKVVYLLHMIRVAHCYH